jgi:hypothetical protein
MNDIQSEKQTYRIPVSTGIFEHWRYLREALWLFLWFIDRTTREPTTDDGSKLGSVLGGMPIRDSDAASTFGCTKRSIRTWRNRLAKFGYIQQKRTGTGYIITLLKSKKWPKRAEDSFHSERKDISTQSGSNCHSEWKQRSLRAEATVILDQTIQGQDKDKTEEGAPGEKSADAPVFCLPDWIPEQTWKEYLEMRVKIRKPMTDKAKSLAVAKLQALESQGQEPKAVLEQSILNSWAGLFTLAKDKTAARGPDNPAVRHGVKLY